MNTIEFPVVEELQYSETSTTVSEKDSNSIFINSIDLLSMYNDDSQLYLVEPILPKIGTAVLAGMPDCGKSQLARQLCISVANGLDSFLGFPLKAQFKCAMYISTEDDKFNTQFLLRKQLDGLDQKASENILLCFPDTISHEALLDSIGIQLSETPCDLVVVDSFGDIFEGADQNSNAAMRSTVKKFDFIAKKYKCLVLFVHHTTKSSYGGKAHQKNVSGGAGLVQKTRVALELANQNAEHKVLTITKANYCPQELKRREMVLDFNEETFIFSNTNTYSINGEGVNEDSRTKKHKECFTSILQGRQLTYGSLKDEFINKSNTSKSTFVRVLKSMGDVIDKKDDLYTLKPVIS